MKIKTAVFAVSNTSPEKCPKGDFPEYAFIGRSNVGKSSLINMITGIKGLAKTSVTPGKTRLINHFLINDEWYLVDLPGYGYARTSKSNLKEFASIITSYLIKRQTLISTFILIDSRLEPQAIDLDFINWMGSKQLPFSIIFTKADKLKTNELQKNVEGFKRTLLETWEELPNIIISSAVKKTGKEDILNYIQETTENLD
jgi:GTP-binding protein